MPFMMGLLRRPALVIGQLLVEVLGVLTGDIGVDRERAVAVGAMTGGANRSSNRLALAGSAGGAEVCSPAANATDAATEEHDDTRLGNASCLLL